MKFVIPPEADGQLLRTYLRQTLRFSARFIKKLTSKRGYIIVNNRSVTVRYTVKTNDVLHIIIPEETRSPVIQPERLPLHIVYEDDWLLIIHKEVGMPSMPSHIHRSGTVANGLLDYYDRKQLPYTVHIVTRLDKDTSGLMLIAKHQYSHYLFAEMQKQHLIERHYEAIVEGRVEEDVGTIQKRIRRKPTSMIKREVAEDGQEAITHYKVCRRFQSYTHVNVQLETGRTHQIRVHFASLGHPLVGDDLYGGNKERLEKQALHCAKLTFTHPMTGKLLTFRAKPPTEWDRLLQKPDVGKSSYT